METNDWTDFFWADLTRTALAVFDRGLWREAHHRELFEFLIHQLGHPQASPAYVHGVFRKYLELFNPATALTRRLAEALKEHWPRTGLPVERLVHEFRLFDLDKNPDLRVASWMDERKQEDVATEMGRFRTFRVLRELGLEAPHGPGLMGRAHEHFVRMLAHPIGRGDPTAIQKLLDWLYLPPDMDHALRGAGAARAIDTLLRPWHRADPAPDVRRVIQERLLAAYGDLRVKDTGEWKSCSEDAQRVMRRWLTGATIDVFFEIVTRADPSHMWPERKRFWTGLYEDGWVTEAWFALSRQAENLAGRLVVKEEEGREPLAFARNTSGNTEDRKKNLLVMNVRGRRVVEGSHNFPVWIFAPFLNDQIAPEMYSNEYRCEQIRSATRSRGVERIVHIGDWQNKVKAAVER